MSTPRSGPVPDSELRLARLIMRRLAGATVISSNDVRVRVVEGQVELHGTVESFSDRLMCTEVAQSVSGGRSVQNDLRVRPFEEGWQLGPGAPAFAPRGSGAR